MRMVQRVLLVAAAVVLASGCGDDDGDKGGAGGGGGGGADESLAAIQADIFDKSCAFSSCHGKGANKGGLELGKAADVTSSQVHAALVGKAAAIDANLVRVKPGDPAGSFLIAKLRANTAQGFKGTSCDESANTCGDPMPQGQPFLGEDKISRIERWISQGAKDN